MAEIKWAELVTVRDWADALAALLEEAEAAARSGTAQSRVAVHDQLHEFIKQSPTAAEPLDAIARQAATDILTAQVETLINSIAERNAELRRATRLIEGVTDEAEKGAGAIQFKKVVDLLGKAKEGIEVLKGLEGTLVDADEGLKTKLEAVFKAIKELEAVAAPK